MTTNIFNQYYFGLLKKVKDRAREIKHSEVGKNPNATYAKILKAIKTNYASYDTLSDEYRIYFIEKTNIFNEWTNFTELEECIKWLKSEIVQNTEVYKGITVQSLLDVSKESHIQYYLGILYLFSKDINENELSALVECIKNLKQKESIAGDIQTIENEEFQKIVQVLHIIQRQSESVNIESSFKQLEGTTLGKLAKEIMSDINIDEIQKSLENEGDIFKALSNPDGGITKLLGSVSQKMIAKMASGELKQETLLQEAMQFSSQLQNIIPNSGGENKGGNPFDGLSGLGDIGNMMQQFQKMTGGGGMDDIREMMSSLGIGKKPAGARHQVDKSGMNRGAIARQLRRKLERKKQKENIQTHVEDESRE
jgi:hypothetical protein